MRPSTRRPGELRASAEVHKDGLGIAKRATGHPEDYCPNVEKRRGYEMKPVTVADEGSAGEELAPVDAGACFEAPVTVALGRRPRQIGSAQERTEVLQEGVGRAEMPSTIATAPRPLAYLGWSGAGYGSVVQVQTRVAAS